MRRPHKPKTIIITTASDTVKPTCATRCRSIWRALLLGQLASLLICVTAACCHLLNKTYHLNLPAAVGFINYVLLCLVYTTWLACRSGERSLLHVLKARGILYAVVALVDVEANYLVLKAYQYTSVISVQLLDCFVVPVVLALSWLALKVRYKLVHVLGVGLCLMGVGCLVWANVEDGKAAIPGTERLLGDMLCLGGATLYGLSNVAQEYAIKKYDHVEFLGMMGLFGSIINGVQMAVLERDEIGSSRWDTWPVLALVGGFKVAQFFFYVVAPKVIKETSATGLNLALFTADFYILALGFALFKFKFQVLYFLSFVLVVLGVIVFVTKPTPIGSATRASYREMNLNAAAAAAAAAHRHHGNSRNALGLANSAGGMAILGNIGHGDHRGGHIGGHDPRDACFGEWPPLPPEFQESGPPEYPYAHPLPQVYEYPATPPSPPHQFRSLPRRAGQRYGNSVGGPIPCSGGPQMRAATLQRPARVRFQLDCIEPKKNHPLPTSWKM
ncbi:unnamed protein product, partial [Meganyctiphanes norvegica]